jgi:two-component system, LytTR family, response regulator
MTGAANGVDAPIRVVIVDDEAPARRRLRRLCDAFADVAVVGEAAAGLAAIDLIGEVSPDVVLLDVQLPDLDGFGVAQAIAGDAQIAIVFVTAHDEHAVRAFEINAVDYLLKPVAATRLRTALDRANAGRHAATTAALVDGLARLRTALPAPRYLERLFVEDRGRIIAVVFDQVERLIAEANYVRLCLPGRELLHRGTLTALAQVLDPDRFVRVSRSAILRIDAIRELVPLGHGDREAVLASGAKVRCSRQYRLPGLGP